MTLRQSAYPLPIMKHDLPPIFSHEQLLRSPPNVIHMTPVSVRNRHGQVLSLSDSAQLTITSPVLTDLHRRPVRQPGRQPPPSHYLCRITVKYQYPLSAIAIPARPLAACITYCIPPPVLKALRAGV